MGEFVQLFGWKFTLLLALGLVAFFALVLFPLWWPGWRAWKQRLPQPWVLAVILAALSYGAWMLLALATVLPMTVYEVYFAPQLHESRIIEYGALDVALQWWTEYWWLAIWPLQGLLTVWLTRWLGRRWTGVWQALSDRAMA
jgi:hypothetical protein